MSESEKERHGERGFSIILYLNIKNWYEKHTVTILYWYRPRFVQLAICCFRRRIIGENIASFACCSNVGARKSQICIQRSICRRFKCWTGYN